MNLLTAGALAEPGFGYTLDRDNSNLAARSADKPFYVVRVARENHRVLAKGYGHHNGVKHICSSGLA
jgi:hypothetical protein